MNMLRIPIEEPLTTTLPLHPAEALRCPSSVFTVRWGSQNMQGKQRLSGERLLSLTRQVMFELGTGARSTLCAEKDFKHSYLFYTTDIEILDSKNICFCLVNAIQSANIVISG